MGYSIYTQLTVVSFIAESWVFFWHLLSFDKDGVLDLTLRTLTTHLC